MNAAQIRHAYALLAEPEASITSIAKLLGVSRTTLYKYLPELGAGGRPAIPGQAPAGELEATPPR